MSRYLPGPGVWIWVLVLALLGIALVIGQCGRPGSDPIPTSPPADTASTDSVQAGMPDTLPPGTFIGRVTTTPRPVRRTVTREPADTQILRRFAEAVARAERWKRERDSLLRLAGTAVDTQRVVDSTPEPRPILAPAAGSYDGDSLRLWLTLSNGRMMRAASRVRPRFRFTAGRGGVTDTIPVVVDDSWWFRQVREVRGCAPWTAGAALLGFAVEGWEGGAAAGGLTLAGCMVD